jgi:Xaa-Pro aminopeptidase
MITAATCRQRRARLWQDLSLDASVTELALTDPVHLAYLAAFWVDPISLGSPFGGLLLVQREGSARLLCENRLPDSVELAQAEERIVVPWYDAQSPGRGPREIAWLARARELVGNFEIADSASHPLAPRIAETLAAHRRRKDAEELAILRKCMTATAAGHAWARANVRPGMTEVDVYNGIAAACAREAGQAVIVYGDFAVSPGPERRGGPATQRVIEPGDMLIVDFSVVLQGYRSDFTNTLVVGREPTPDQRRLYELCRAAMSAGEKELRAGVPCQAVYDAVRGAFDKEGMADWFPHHAGHGLGLTHPEAPYLVRHSTETLQEDDVITLEPGLYVTGVGGIRIERNYRITPTGFECLSPHTIALQ